jgi:transaldolase/glucose-6-phosphate isomerase
MHSAQDLVTRWPSLDTAARHARLNASLTLSPGPLDETIRRLSGDADRAARGLWRRDPAAWSADAAVQKAIDGRLGWLTSPILMADSLNRLHSFAEAVRRDAFTDVVLLGMGGSSLAPEVLRSALGVQPGWPRFHMLDSTDPAAVQAAATPPHTTLYIIASKSGTTIEPNSLAAHFRRRLEDSQVVRWADQFVAITDEGTTLAQSALEDGFRDVFINPSDIGGRYSALSFFGLVPAALMGQDVSALVGWGAAMFLASEPAGDAAINPSVGLGLAMGAAARAGRDKLTLVLPAELESFGLWVEQLVAESTGKQGLGIIPIAGEPIGQPSEYDADRFFVCMRRVDDRRGNSDVRNLTTANLPVAIIEMPEVGALGAEFARWEVATAVAGAILGVNPFDEPNVQQAKDATRALLTQYKGQQRLPVPPADRTLPDGVALTVSASARERLSGATLEAFLTLIAPGDYFSLLAYLGPDPVMADVMHRFRLAVRHRARAATMFGYGPRYLHSTGQLHKGGPNTGVFLLITASPQSDVPIPGEAFSFGTLEQAQALGDFTSLDAAGRRVLHAHLPAPDAQLLRSLTAVLLDHLPGRT